MRTQTRTVEHELVRIAETQHGVVTRAQLACRRPRCAGVCARACCSPSIGGLPRRASRAKRQGAVHDGRTRCGDGALLSGRAAAHLLGLLKGSPPGPEVITTTERRIEGIRTRRSRSIDPRDAMAFRGIAITTVPRILVDLAAVLAVDDLARACHEAGVLHRATPTQVEAVLARRRNSPGAAPLRRVLRGEIHVTLSKLEGRFLALLREAGLALSQTNRPAGGRRVDCRWPKHRLIVELDSYTFHQSRHAWEQDRRREREARARGDDLRRYTYGDVFEHPRLMLQELTALLPQRCPA